MNPHLGGPTWRDRDGLAGFAGPVLAGGPANWLPIQVGPGNPGDGLLWSVLLLASIVVAVVVGVYVAVRNHRDGRDAYAGAEATLKEVRVGGRLDEEERGRQRNRFAGRPRRRP